MRHPRQRQLRRAVPGDRMRILGITRITTMARCITTILLLESKIYCNPTRLPISDEMKNGIANIPHLRHRHHAKRRHVAAYSTDFDTSNSVEVRKYLKTYGLTPPGVDTFEKQEQRCKHIHIYTRAIREIYNANTRIQAWPSLSRARLRSRNTSIFRCSGTRMSISSTDFWLRMSRFVSVIVDVEK
jgi:hypothetical protein